MLKVDGTVVNIGHFPDGTLLIKHPANYSEKEKQMCHEIQWLFENNEEMVALMYLTRHLQSHGVDRIELLMPYIPNARQDRVKSSEDVFTLKYFAEFINALGFSKVTVLDPHSYVSEALINNIVVKSPIDYISVAIGGTRPNLLFFPDEGAMKRYSGMFSLPYAFGIKKRDWQTGQIQGLDVAGSTELIKDATILIVDDISSRGGTFYYSAKKLKELGAGKIFLYISHCENTILQGEVLTSGLIERVYTTKSIYTADHEKIGVISV